MNFTLTCLVSLENLFMYSIQVRSDSKQINMIDRSLSSVKFKHAVFISILNRKAKHNLILVT